MYILRNPPHFSVAEYQYPVVSAGIAQVHELSQFNMPAVKLQYSLPIAY